MDRLTPEQLVFRLDIWRKLHSHWLPDEADRQLMDLREYLQSLSQEAVRDEAEWLIFMEGKRAGRAEAEQALKHGPLGMRVCEPPCHSAGACLHPDSCRANMKWENERALKREPNAAGQDRVAGDDQQCLSSGATSRSTPSSESPAPAAHDVAIVLAQLGGIAKHMRAAYPNLEGDAYWLDQAAALLAKLGQEPVAWRREWEGDISDIGHMIYVDDPHERDEPLSRWQPLYAEAPGASDDDSR